MKKIILTSILVLAAVNFTACSEGDVHFKDATQLIQVADCNSSSNTVMQSDDVLVKDVTPTVVSIYHDETGAKKICTQGGLAHIVRN